MVTFHIWGPMDMVVIDFEKDYLIKVSLTLVSKFNKDRMSNTNP